MATAGLTTLHSSSSSISPPSSSLTSSPSPSPSPSPRSAVLLGQRSTLLPLSLRPAISLTSSGSLRFPLRVSSSSRSSFLLSRCGVSSRSQRHSLPSRRFVAGVSPSSTCLGYGRSSERRASRDAPAALSSSRFFGGSRVLLPLAGRQRRRQRTANGGSGLKVWAMKENVERALATGIRVGRQSWDAVVAMVPDSVPRPVARSGVGVMGVLIAWTILKALISTVMSLVVVAGVGFVIFRYIGGGDGSGGEGGGGGGMGGGSGSMNDDEALAEAKRIMDKYK